ncbi:AAA family ATPase [Nocardia sp. NPDC052566]|uniref:AAA family ATPase n=1 Tax=Nocardia sp. NPDC052566 TaxID=3364330 RepID=UPI0037C595F5
MRIAVVGAYGNGKTTLTTKLADLLDLPRVHGAPMRNPVGTVPKSLEDCSDLELLQLTLRRFAERITAEERVGAFVSDGSSLHEWVYLAVRSAVGRHPDVDRLPPASRSPYFDVVAHVGAVVQQRTAGSYDLFVHLPAEIPLAAGETAINEQFRVLSDRLLLDTLDGLGCPVHVVRGDAEERLTQVVALAQATNTSSAVARQHLPGRISIP